MSTIEVVVNVVGFFGAESIAVGQQVALQSGARVADALAVLFDQGALSKPVYQEVKKLRPPLYLVINDEKVAGTGTTIALRDGDVVTVMQIMAGG